MTKSNGFRVSLTDEDVAEIIVSVADATAGSHEWRVSPLDVVATAVATGRALGRRVPLEPLDDGLRSVAAAAADELANRGLAGITLNLRRLDAFLQRYPARGVPDPDEPLP